jgi:hypothetical protein
VAAPSEALMATMETAAAMKAAHVATSHVASSTMPTAAVHGSEGGRGKSDNQGGSESNRSHWFNSEASEGRRLLHHFVKGLLG